MPSRPPLRHIMTAHWWMRLPLFFALSLLLATFAYLPLGEFFALESWYLGLIAASLLVEAMRKEGAWYTVGLLPGRFMIREIGRGLALALLLCLAALAIALALDGALTLADVGIVWEHHLLVGMYMLLYAVAEELLFRGLVFQALLERFGRLAALMYGALFFAFLHCFNVGFSGWALLNLLLAGLLLSAMYLQTRSLWMPIAFHFGWNFCVYLILSSPVSGNEFGSGIVRIEVPENSSFYEIIMGGRFGIEEGIVTTLLLAVGLAVTLRRSWALVAPPLAARLFRRRFVESALLDNERRMKTDESLQHNGVSI